MKFLNLFICSMLATALASCNDEDDIIYDFYPYELCISVQNPAGENLLDPDVEGNILDETVEMDYEGKTYPMNIVESGYLHEVKPLSRYYMPHFYGLVAYSYPKDYSQELSTNHLYFGEFDCAYSGNYACTLRIPSRGITRRFEIRILNKNNNVRRTLYIDYKEYKGDIPLTLVLD